MRFSPGLKGSPTLEGQAPGLRPDSPKLRSPSNARNLRGRAPSPRRRTLRLRSAPGQISLSLQSVVLPRNLRACFGRFGGLRGRADLSPFLRQGAHGWIHEVGSRLRRVAVWVKGDSPPRDHTHCKARSDSNPGRRTQDIQCHSRATRKQTAKPRVRGSKAAQAVQRRLPVSL